MNLPLNPKQIAQTAVLNGHLIPAGEVLRAVSNWPKEEFDYEKVKLPSEAGIQRTDAPKSPRRYVTRKPKLPLTPVTKNGKHLFIIYPR